jgi:hypothetical protein
MLPAEPALNVRLARAVVGLDVRARRARGRRQPTTVTDSARGPLGPLPSV